MISVESMIQWYFYSGPPRKKCFQLTFPEDQKPPFRFGTVDGGNTHETMKRNWHKMHDYVLKNKFFTPNISSGVEAVRSGYGEVH